MSIRELIKKIKIFAPNHSQSEEVVSFDENGEVEHFSLFKKLFLSLTIILLVLLSFGIGRLSVTENQEPIKIEYDPTLLTQPVLKTKNTKQTSSVLNALKNIESGEVVSSKNGSKYHYLHCPSAKQIKEDNKIVFVSAEAAEAQGYTLAANCSPIR